MTPGLLNRREIPGFVWMGETIEDRADRVRISWIRMERLIEVIFFKCPVVNESEVEEEHCLNLS